MRLSVQIQGKMGIPPSVTDQNNNGFGKLTKWYHYIADKTSVNKSPIPNVTPVLHKW